jgi:hypothetical protein
MPILSGTGGAMTRFLTTIVLVFGVCLTADADVWKWTDAFGKTHFVDTMTPIFTWVDESGKIHYSDTPDHEDAVSVELNEQGEREYLSKKEAAATLAETKAKKDELCN